MKRFVLGFLIGIGLMYSYLHHGEELWAAVDKWFGKTAAKYRDDRQHEAAREALGETDTQR